MPSEFIVTSIHMIGIDDLKKRWGWFVGLGLLLVALGVIALASSVLFTIASVLFFGFLLIFVGALQTLHAIIAKRWGGFFMDLVIGLLNGAVGVVIVTNPQAAAEAVTLVIALFLILGGVFRIALALAIRFQHLIWLALHGAISVLLGVLILQQWPLSGLWVIGLFIGIDMICNGWSLVMLGMAAKRISPDSV
jgi:uncharacterized membrane protein HdeD (DUF308 family)